MYGNIGRNGGDRGAKNILKGLEFIRTEKTMENEMEATTSQL